MRAVRRAVSVIGTIVPASIVFAIVWYITEVCGPEPAEDCLFVNLEGTARGFAYMATMLCCGGLLAVSFANLDRALGLRQFRTRRHKGSGRRKQ